MSECRRKKNSRYRETLLIKKFGDHDCGTELLVYAETVVVTVSFAGINFHGYFWTKYMYSSDPFRVSSLKNLTKRCLSFGHSTSSQNLSQRSVMSLTIAMRASPSCALRIRRSSDISLIILAAISHKTSTFRISGAFLNSAAYSFNFRIFLASLV